MITHLCSLHIYVVQHVKNLNLNMSQLFSRILDWEKSCSSSLIVIKAMSATRQVADWSWLIAKHNHIAQHEMMFIPILPVMYKTNLRRPVPVVAGAFQQENELMSQDDGYKLWPRCFFCYILEFITLMLRTSGDFIHTVCSDKQEIKWNTVTNTSGEGHKPGRAEADAYDWNSLSAIFTTHYLISCPFLPHQCGDLD